MYKIFKINELGEQTVERLYSIKDQIDFSPYYQRFGNIWSLQKKQLLIDTIINNFDIPKFYLNYFIEANNDININNKLYAIIDGKQRLQAIFDFLDDKYPLDEKMRYIDDEHLELKGLRYSEILETLPQVAPKILGYVLDVVFITTDEEDRLEELFLRLNGGVALTNAEKRNAILSYLNTRIRDIIKSNDFFTTKIKFNNPRYQHNDLLTKILFIESEQNLANLGNQELEDFLRLHNTNNDENNDLINRTIYNINLLCSVFEDHDTLLKSKGLIPVYYQFVKDKITLAEPQRLHDFFVQFDKLKQENRSLADPNPILQEFDRLNQQGVHREKSLLSRYRIFETYFQEFLATGHLDNPMNITGLEIDDTDNFDEF